MGEGDGRGLDTILRDGFAFWDGSCRRHLIKDLSRATWGHVYFDSEQRIAIQSWGAVPAPLPQTSQSGEYMGYLSLAHVPLKSSTPIVRVWGDCASVIKKGSQSEFAQLNPKHRYSGLMRKRSRLDASHALALPEKVKSHVAIRDDMDPFERFLFRGNHMADTLCLHGYDLHWEEWTGEEEAVWEEVGNLVTIGLEVCRVIATMSPKWPKLPRGKLRVATVPRDRPPVLSIEHQWQFSGGLWRCTVCCRFAHGDESSPPDHFGGCTGLGGIEGHIDVHPSHFLIRATCLNVPFLFCSWCGCRAATRRRIGLKSECWKRPHDPAMASSLNAMLKGLHPLKQELIFHDFMTEDFARVHLSRRRTRSRQTSADPAARTQPVRSRRSRPASAPAPRAVVVGTGRPAPGSGIFAPDHLERLQAMRPDPGPSAPERMTALLERVRGRQF